MTRNSFENTLSLFKSQDPGARQIAAVSGVLAYGLSRLTPPQYGQFIAWCVEYGLPISPAEAIGTANPQMIEAMIALIWGTLSEIDQGNLSQYALNIAGLVISANLTVGTCAIVMADSSAESIIAVDSAVIGNDVNVMQNMIVAGDITILDDSSTDVDIIPQNNLAVGVATPENRGFATDGPILAGSFTMAEKLNRGDGEDSYVAGLTMLYEDRRMGLTTRKGVGGLRAAVGNPLYDSLWMEVRPGVRGTAYNASQAPLQYNFKLDILTSGAAGLVGNASDVVEAQVFVRSAGPNYAWVSPGGMLTAPDQPPESLSGTNIQLVYDAISGSVRVSFQLGPWARDLGGNANIVEARLLLWARGGF